MLFIKGFIVGLGKIIPGVSGAMLAINFKVYERLINSLTNFFADWRSNMKFLLIFGFGILLAIIFGSNIILILFNKYKFLTLMFFLGLIMAGTYNYSKTISFNLIIVLLIFCLFLFIGFTSFNQVYILRYNFLDIIFFFIGGIIEILASIVPGISATSLLMMLGIYNYVLEMVANIFDYNYVVSHINIYISYGLGMAFSFVVNIYLIAYLFRKYPLYCNSVILGLSLSSIVFFLIVIFKIKFVMMELILGIILFICGIGIASIFDK